MPIDVAIFLLATIGLLFLAVYRWGARGETWAFYVAVVMPLVFLVLGAVLRGAGDIWTAVLVLVLMCGGLLVTVLLQILRSHETCRSAKTDPRGSLCVPGPRSSLGIEVYIQVGPRDKRSGVQFLRMLVLCDGIEQYAWEDERAVLGPDGVDGFLRSLRWLGPRDLVFVTGAGKVTITNEEGVWSSSDSVLAAQAHTRSQSKKLKETEGTVP